MGLFGGGKNKVNLEAIISADNRKFNAAVSSSKGRIARFAKIGAASFAAISAAAVGTAVVLSRFVNQVATIGDDLDKMSGRTGFAVESLDKLQFAAERGGATLDDVEKAIKKFQKTAVDAGERGLETYLYYFRELGVELKDSEGNFRDTEQLFFDTAIAISELESATERAGYAQQLFGRAGTSLLPMLKGGEEGFRSLMEKAEDYGIVTRKITGDSAQFKDNIYDLTRAARGMKITLASELIPEVNDMIEDTLKWYVANKDLINSGILSFAKDVAAVMETLASATRTVVENYDKLSRVGGFMMDIAPGTKDIKWLIDQFERDSVKTLLGTYRPENDVIRARTRTQTDQTESEGQTESGPQAMIDMQAPIDRLTSELRRFNSNVGGVITT
jgi:hypothetical protein